MDFNNRVFGCAIVKAINSNYNADFSGLPRTLPNGKVYATDKAFKYSMRNLIKNFYPEQTVFYFKTLNEKMNPISLNETYIKYFGDFPKEEKGTKGKGTKGIIAKNLLSCIDIRLFGATFAGQTNISIHGPVQIGHGLNIWNENNIYTEQITAPFSNKSNDSEAEKGMTTIGRQSKLEEGHYVHAFSINPNNLKQIQSLAGEGAQFISDKDIIVLKEAMRQGVSLYDSSAKAGSDNELLLWVELQEGSKLILPSFTELIDCKSEKHNNSVVYDFTKITSLLNRFSKEIKTIELYINSQSVVVENAPDNTNVYEIFGVEVMELAL